MNLSIPILENFIYSNTNSMSGQLCDEIIQMYEEESDGKYEGITASGLNKKIKKTMDFIINKSDSKWTKIHQFLEKELHKNVKIYIDELNKEEGYNTDQYSTNKYKILNYQAFSTNHFMIQRYIKNSGRYIYHEDFAVEWKEEKYRVITFLWYLNTLDEGGETEFWGNYRIRPEKGKLVLFPASWTFPHCGKMPISDNKYIITGWLYVHNNNT